MDKLSILEQEFLAKASNAIIKQIIATQKPCIKIKLTSKEPLLSDSKFGGLPYLAKDDKAPCDNENHELTFLAQINLSQLPDNTIFPTKKGLIQFWLRNDDVYGLDSLDGYKVTFYKDIDLNITKESVLAKYHPYVEDDSYDMFPIIDEFALTFTNDYSYLSWSNDAYQNLVDTQLQKLIEKNNEYQEIFDKYKDDQYKLITFIEEYDNNSLKKIIEGFGHQIGGYPSFTQSDVIVDENAAYNILLLQIDTDSLDDKEIMWGDSGIANFFIKEKDLKKLDFNDILYNWDCC